LAGARLGLCHSIREQGAMINMRIRTCAQQAARFGSAVMALTLIIVAIGFASRQALAQSDTGLSSADSAKLKAAIDSTKRPETDRARDKYRHPLETLSFLGIKPGMTVVEIWPGGGWYSEILAPYLKPKGKLYAAIAPGGEGAAAYRQMLASDPAYFGTVTITELDPPAKMQIAPAGSADMVLTFRNVHNWMRRGEAEDVFKAMYHALKPGGVLGLVEHRGDPTKPQDPQAASGYVREDEVIKLAEQAGFQPAGKSEINANPKDTKDYAKGVWTLPPTLRLGDVDRAKYLAIGESDRMTLKFIKPLKLARR
jgi:predicted methyltransferase